MKSKYVIQVHYCTLNANSKFNFEILFDFIKIIKEYLKHFIQNNFKKALIFISSFS
jgi:hypothetical protein